MEERSVAADAPGPGAPVDLHAFVGKKIYMFGIGGSGMPGLAGIPRAKGCTVFGSDAQDGGTVRRLREDRP